VRNLLLAAAISILPFPREEPPIVRMLVPGFRVRELPVRLLNVNNLRFAPDDRLTALTYDGEVHLLSDSDGDGLEESDCLFFSEPRLTVPVGMQWAPEGLYVSSHGKVSLLRDVDGDFRADQEEIIACGWPPTEVGTNGVDATAVTRDLEGNIYFGLLVADYSNAYQLREGVAHYDLKSPRGTIQRWSPKTRNLETLATGIRVPYTLAFNRLGDLFVTDQEGETWMPGGNPLDELNHVIAGRNYGFPPRHEQYLQGLISEPPVVTFGPQHQSACGFLFNEGGGDQKSFGPASFEGDAIVTGESRGKLWRVRLARTDAGYVGKESLIARLSMLATDVALSKDGALYVCCHSGSPDWGTGPKGPGKLFKIEWIDTEAPQPLITWPEGPFEVRVAFDRPLDPRIVEAAAGGTIELGPFVSAADRFEILKPPYQSVREQESSARGTLDIESAKLLAGGRTLSITTGPHPQSVRYALTLPAAVDSEGKSAGEIDLCYDLHGIQAAFSPADGSERVSLWMPHVDLGVVDAFCGQSALHRDFLRLVRQDGLLEFRGQWLLPAEECTVEARANGRLKVSLGRERAGSAESDNDQAKVWVTASGPDRLVPFSIQLETSKDRAPELSLCFSTRLDPTRRPVPLDQLLVPWAPALPTSPGRAPAPTDLAGGDYERGRDLYFNDKLRCAACHVLRGEGKGAGPDLSDLRFRSVAAIRQDIDEPNVSIHPDFVSFRVSMQDGQEHEGLVESLESGQLRVTRADSSSIMLERANVTKIRASSVSMMPAGLLQGASEAQVRDLLTFVCNAPPERSREEVEAAVRSGAKVAEDDAPAGLASKGDASGSSRKSATVILVAGPQDHGPLQHDYPTWQSDWAELLSPSRALSVENAWEWPEPEQLASADVLVFYFWNHDWSSRRLRELNEHLKKGGGAVFIHSACIADQRPEVLAGSIGLSAQPGRTGYLHAPFELRFLPDHPLANGFTSLHLLDEPYWPMIGEEARVDVVATAHIEGKARPLMWTLEQDGGRVFVSIPGHYTWTLRDPLVRLLFLRALAWAARMETSSLDSLVTPPG